jgi:hypothetical protein
MWSWENEVIVFAEKETRYIKELNFAGFPLLYYWMRWILHCISSDLLKLDAMSS